MSLIGLKIDSSFILTNRPLFSQGLKRLTTTREFVATVLAISKPVAPVAICYYLHTISTHHDIYQINNKIAEWMTMTSLFLKFVIPNRA